MAKKIHDNAGAAEQARYKSISDARKLLKMVSHEPADPAELAAREECRHDLEKWLLRFRPDNYPIPFSDDQRTAILKLQRVVLSGGSFAFALPRGSGKTTFSTDAVLWAALEGHRIFSMLISATAQESTQIINEIKTALAFSDELLAAYPEVTTYFRALDGRNSKAASQLDSNGEPTRIQMRKDEIVFPRIDGSLCSESVIRTRGITGAIRGAKYARADGVSVRPDLALVDDPQTEESAASLEQCKKRYAIITKTILGLAGPGKNIACAIPCTVIEDGDLACMLLDRQMSPQFQGTKCPMVYEWPKNMELWDTYCEMRKDEMRNADDDSLDDMHVESLAYYQDNREAMDEGAKVAWEGRYDASAGEVSALQAAFNLLVSVGEDAFESEYQNNPTRHSDTDYKLTPEIVASRVNGLPKYTAPDDAACLVTGCDINYSGLNYVVMAVKNPWTGYVVDAGKWPAGRGRLVPKGDLTQEEIEGYIWEGLQSLHKELSGRNYRRGSNQMHIDLSVVDIGGSHMQTVVNWIKQAHTLGHKVMASQGASNRKFKPKSTDKLAGDGWLIRDRAEGKVKTRVLVHNSDTTRVKMQRSFLKSPGGPGTISLWGTSPKAHRRTAEQCSAEFIKEIIPTADGDQYEWGAKPGADWDIGDAMSMCLAAAGSWGIGRRIVSKKKQRKRARVRSMKI